jgi:putative ABC transport system substrate-binding protein
LAAKAATSTVPTIFVVGGDPVKLGLAASYPRPGGNATGISIVTSELAAKRLGLAHDLLPEVTTIGFLVNPRFPTIEAQLRDTREAAQRIGLQIDVFNASTDNEIDLAFETIVQQGTRLLIIAADPFFDTRRGQLVALSAHHSVPSLYQSREYIGAGGLISYGIDLADVYRQAGVYATRILKGSAPGDLPILEQSKFELVINRTTAKVLGVNVPYVLLAQADEVIE